MCTTYELEPRFFVEDKHEQVSVPQAGQNTEAPLHIHPLLIAIFENAGETLFHIINCLMDACMHAWGSCKLIKAMLLNNIQLTVTCCMLYAYVRYITT